MHLLARLKQFVISIVAFLTIPIWLPLVLIFFGTELAFLPTERQLFKRMRRCGRSCNIDVLMTGGTLIHDRPTFNWGYSRLWWTPDDVLAKAPIAPGTCEQRAIRRGLNQFYWHDFDRWVWERYLEESQGTAKLLAVWHPDRKLRRIRERFPEYRIVKSFSGGRQLEKYAPIAQADDGSGHESEAGEPV